MSDMATILNLILTFLAEVLDHPAPLRPLTNQVSSRIESHISSSQQQWQQTNTQPPKPLPKPFTQQASPALPKASSDVQPQPPPTYSKPFIHAPQTRSKPQRFTQPLTKLYLQASPPNHRPKAQVPPQTLPKPQSLHQALAKSKSLPLDHSEVFSSQHILSGDLLSPTESGDTSVDRMSSKRMSIKDR